MFVSPGGCQLNKVCTDDVDLKLAVDGWVVQNPVLDPTANISTGVPSAIMTAAQAQLFEERPLAPWETEMMQNFAARHPSREDSCLPSRSWWLKAYGLWSTPLRQHMIDTPACSNMILATTGQPSGPSSGVGSPCGSQRYCLKCEEVLQKLDSMYHVYVMVDCVLAALAKAVKVWVGKDSVSFFARTETSESAHKCGPLCGENPQPGC